ncbi:hypothetical protein AGOR_G00005600 [Albula goreensis]|uniref:Uncharacterized protein n=1 Tax=Albula goreensis TaxID=1534307 RepID=A0A8T3E5P3_9TELE|nr:hypothetical protein AGOR_G00005600 [Albula goreensis]
MMSSKPTPRFMDQVAQGTLPRVERTVGTTLSSELPKSGYPPEDPVNYSGTYFYCLSGAAGTDLSPHWSPPGSSLQKSPIVHPPGTGQPLTNQVTHRPEKTVHCMENSPSSVMQDLAANQKQAYYDTFPGKQSSNVPRIHAPTAVRKLGIGGASISPPRENLAGLAVPKPIYGHNPCCTEHGCTSGACYSMERGMPRLHPNSYDDEWMLHYGPLSLLQRKEREALLQQGLLQLEQSAVQFPLRDTRPEGYRTLRPSGPVRFPPFAEQNYGSFPYTSPTRSPLSPSSDLFHRLQFPSKVYHGLHPPSSCTYEEMQQMALTYPGIQPKIYPDRPPPVPRYTHLPQRPMFYYPQGSIEIENSMPYKGAGKKLPVEPPSSTNKQVPSDSPGSCLRPPLTQTDFSASCPTAPANPSFPRDCDLSPFQVYRTHTGTVGQKRTFAEGPGAPLLVRHTEQPVDYSAQRARMDSPQRRLCKQPLSPGAFHPIQQPLPDYRSSDHMSVAKCKILANHRSEDKQASPKQAVPHCGVGQRQHGAGPGPGPGPAMHASSPCTEVATSEKHRPNANSADHAADLSNMAQVDKSHNIYEVEAPNRLQEKAADQNLIERLQNPPSPPMPVINKVFSLAPYKAYLQASGMLPSQKGLPVGAHCNDNNVKSDTQRHTADPQQDVVEPMHKVTSVVCSQPSPEAGPICMLEPHEIKTENVSLEDTDISVKSDETGCEGGHQSLKEITRTIKEEDTNEVTSSSDSVLDLRVKKGDCDVSASEIQTSTGLSSLEYRVGTPDAIRTMGVLTLNCNNEHSVHMALPPKPVMPPLVPPDKKVFFQHVPPQGVKLSAFKIIVPDVLRPPPQTHQTQALEVPQPTPEPKPAIDSSRQARHRFMEMQQSLFRLISASVAQAPEQELRAWLAKTEPLEPTSPQPKALCVSGLLGTATREAWLRCKDTAAALARVVGQLEDYAVTRQCPFPHVIRAGTLFIPMLVVKECLFPQVSGALIDKVLQEHHVELRPTTLSEERHLMQLQRRACSSKLRRLLSLKHLPEIYPDMLNLFYHACVSKRLDTTSPAGSQKTAQVQCSAPQ